MKFTLYELCSKGLVNIYSGEDGVKLSVYLAFFALCGIIAYLLGSLNFAVIISRIKYKDDIRNHGSGNAGMTNMMRTYGRVAGIFTFLGDALKAAVSIIIGMVALGSGGAYAAGVCCIIGHVYPLYYKFKGGKGVVVTAIMVLFLDPVIFLVLFIIFALVLVFTHYISLASIMSMLMYPLVLRAFYPTIHGLAGVPALPMISSVVISAFVIFLHRENMQRLLNHKENKFFFTKKGKEKYEKDNKK